MILISVKSDLMDVKRQYETDKEAEKYLLFVNKAHENERLRLGRKFIYDKYGISAYEANKTLKQVCSFAKEFVSTCLPLKVEIINTEHAQLNFATQLK